jgi:hypothetical protein
MKNPVHPELVEGLSFFSAGMEKRAALRQAQGERVKRELRG